MIGIGMPSSQRRMGICRSSKLIIDGEIDNLFRVVQSLELSIPWNSAHSSRFVACKQRCNHVAMRDGARPAVGKSFRMVGDTALRFVQPSTALGEKLYALCCEPIGRSRLIMPQLRVAQANKRFHVRLHGVMKIRGGPRFIGHITE
jgi:hypothetical protein